MNRSELIRLTEEIGFLPESRFGQNFLCDEESISRIIELCGIRAGDKILEIGPGLGSLTRELDSEDTKLTCVEIDKRLAEYISDSIGCRVISSDYTKLDPTEYDADSYDIAVSNIPYYVMTPIMKKMLSELKNARKIVLMVEKEALQRIICRPSTKQYGPLSILCELWGEIKIVFDLPGKYYYPVPKTQSTVFTITRGEYADQIDPGFVDFLEKCFAQRRKKLLNNVPVNKELLKGLGYNENTRAEEITPIDLLKLYSDIILSV